ncbi:4Fe-4S dicluster domain-containing protein [Sporomusa silvacetica]|nr:4Fe-4S dicluster domain-containing protein [Sporomusa silvacetica]
MLTVQDSYESTIIGKEGIGNGKFKEPYRLFSLRPPGALPEPEFTAVCNRCGRCVQVCPSNALCPMPITDGLANFETPHIVPRRNRCDLCLACQKVCPTGAIAEVPLEEIRMGKAVIDKSRCIAWNEGKMCYICGEQCPVLAINADEYHRPTVLPDKCVGCGSCENACPIDGEAAIRVFPN